MKLKTCYEKQEKNNMKKKKHEKVFCITAFSVINEAWYSGALKTEDFYFVSYCLVW